MKRKISILISALCALGACASFTACMTDSQNGNDENIEKAKSKTNIVEQQNNDDNNDNNGNDCPDGNCPDKKPEFPDMENMPPMPEFRFIPHPEHMPSPANIDENNDNEGENNEDDKDQSGETTEENKKPPMPAPHKGGKIKPKMPKKER